MAFQAAPTARQEPLAPGRELSPLRGHSAEDYGRPGHLCRRAAEDEALAYPGA